MDKVKVLYLQKEREKQNAAVDKIHAKAKSYVRGIGRIKIFAGFAAVLKLNESEPWCYYKCNKMEKDVNCRTDYSQHHTSTGELGINSYRISPLHLCAHL